MFLSVLLLCTVNACLFWAVNACLLQVITRFNDLFYSIFALLNFAKSFQKHAFTN